MNLLFPIRIWRVIGHSMSPAFTDGARVLVDIFFWRLQKISSGDVVVIKHPYTGLAILKRVGGRSNEDYLVFGDNKADSHDSIDFGPVKKSSIIGRVFATYKVH